MKADYLSFQRATRVSLLGLLIQLALGLLLLLFGLFNKDIAAQTGSVYVLMGVPVWLCLAILFDQHRRERIEAIEAEAFAASDAAASSVFEERSDDLRVAARRLKTLYKFMLPGVSLLVGGLLVGVGIWRFIEARNQLALLVVATPTNAASTIARGWPIAITISIAVVGFLVARYVSGLAKQKVWANMRAGAGFAVGTALFGLAIAVGHFLALAHWDPMLRYLPIIYAAVLVLLGAEIFLNFVLDVYRPRKPGEYPRPAFESRVLGFIAAPDRIAESIGEAINYQFGYDVSSSWFYQLLSRVVLRVLVPVALLTLWAMSALVVIRPHEMGLVTRFGKLGDDGKARVLQPGLHLKWPWPIERVEIPKYIETDSRGKVVYSGQTVTGVRTLEIGSLAPDPSKPALWDIEHPGKETFFLVQPGSGGPSATGRELAVMAIEVPLQYSIEDLEAYDRLGPPEMRDSLLRATAQRALMQFASTLSVQELLSSRRDELRTGLRTRMQEALSGLGEINPQTGKPRGAGVRVVYVGVNGLHPPKDTVLQFQQVVEAQQKSYARLSVARGAAIKTLTSAVGSVELANTIAAELDELDRLRAAHTDKSGQPDPAIVEQQLKIRGLIQKAGGKAAAVIQEASADRWERHMGERARLEAYRGQLGSYRAAPAYYRASLYMDALKTAMADARLYITDAANKLTFRFNMEDRDTSAAEIIRSNPSN